MRNTDTPLRVLAFCVMLVAFTPGVLEAQSPQPERRAEVFVSAGASGFSRYDDKGFGRHSDIGAGVAVLVHPRFAVQVEVEMFLNAQTVARVPSSGTDDERRGVRPSA